MSRTHLVFALLVSAALALGACGSDDDGRDPLAGTPDAGATDTGGDSADTGTDDRDTGGSTDAGADDLAASLYEPGPYAVGHRQLQITYRPPGATEDRVVPLRVWYPAAPGSDAGPAVYEVGGTVELQPELALDSPEPAEGGPFPVAVYSHGSGGDSLLAYPFAERFASYGWVVASPDHVGNTALEGLGGEFAPFAQNALYRVTDISQVFDGLESGLGDPALEGLSDLERVFLFGHSFGGYTTLAVAGADVDRAALEARCEADADGSCEFLADPEVQAAFDAGFGDPRVDAIAPQAPALIPYFDEGALAGLEMPVMLQSGSLDVTTTEAEQAQPLWDALDGPEDVWIDLTTGAHYSFITICDDLDPALLNLFRPDAVADGCGAEFVPTAEAVPALRAYLLAFARLHVLGEDQWRAVIEGDALLDGFEVRAK